jgi:hypothetical protein
LAVVDLDTADHEPDDLAPHGPVKQVEAVTELGREVLQAPDDQDKIMLRRDSVGERRALFFELGDTGPEVGDARRELGTLDDTLCIPVDQPADAAPQGADPAFDLPQIGVCPIADRQFAEAAAVLMGDPLGLVQDGFDLRPDGTLEPVTAHRAIIADRRAIEPVAVAADAAVGTIPERARAVALAEAGR